ncbi:hypothetical protein LNKW23_37370 [Paralimibaculum aggregatum]|uniref:DUF4214 domain-containing protein n=1 Tax=Paralimibaculum aggregatum TaxID=3036245 RepID=A0ABQ6LPM8_9RHOB|nr:DUF4214 domain-containing protein [Limibaculum sp. NKW23]GMG84521.1 hypothetical protein LNKW23_37370 [Limibaculum sp. NKW23]
MDAQVVDVEIEGADIEIAYADGSEEEIDAGIYERKDASGETVEERPATDADRQRLLDLAAGFAGEPDDDDDSGDTGGGEPAGDTGMDRTVTKIEIFGANIEVEYSDGTREEIEFGIYERKDMAGDTVEERAATVADRTRLESLSIGDAVSGDGTPVDPGDGMPGGPAFPAPDATVTGVEILGDTIEVAYSDGSKEEIEAGVYELKDPAGETILERPATATDRVRLEGIAAGNPAVVAQAFPLADGSILETGPNRIEQTFPDGSRIEIEGGIYEEKAADGTTIVERPATQADIDGLTALLPAGVDAPDLSPGAPAPGNDDGTPDQGPGDAPGTPGSDDTPMPGGDDGTPDQGPGDALRMAEDVTLFYTETLGRAPDRTGLNFWIDALEDRFDLDDLAEAFLDSFEFAEAVGDPDGMENGAFVETLYDDLLERAADTDGILFWTSFLDGGGARAELVVAFVISDENRANTPELDNLVEVSPGEWEIAG